MEKILRFIAAYKQLYEGYPKYVVSPANAGKTLYVMEEEFFTIRSDNNYLVQSKVIAVASTTPPIAIPILAREEPKAN